MPPTGSEAIGNPALGGILQGLLGGPNPGQAYLSRMLPMLINLGLVGAVVVFFFMLLFGGVEWMMSGGDKQNVERARGRITGALIGIVIVFSIFAILTLVGTIFGVTLTTIRIPTVNSPTGGV